MYLLEGSVDGLVVGESLELKDQVGQARVGSQQRLVVESSW